MSLDEIRTRVVQEVSKRVDFARYQTGLLSLPNGLKYSAQIADSQFFLSGDDLLTIPRILREHLPSEVEAIVNEADQICRHRFQLLGYENLDYGPEIDWHFDAVHGKRAPLKAWYKVPFLDFAEVGDHKVIWELNRHQHFVTLAKAWRFTNDDKYVAEITRQFYSCQVANPYPLGINWGSSLEVAFRSLSWLWVRFLLSNCSAIAENFQEDLSKALALNGHYIERYLSIYFSPNTHLLGEAVALFFIGTLCPHISSSGKWRKNGWEIILQEAERQVRPDGIYFEQSLYYHVYALDFFLHARILAMRNGVQVPDDFDHVLNKMLDVVAALSQAGAIDSFGDDDGGRVFNPRRNRCEHLTDPLALGAILYGRDDLKHRAVLTEEAVWLFGERAISGLCRQNVSILEPQTAAFKAGGIYVMADSAPYPVEMVIDAGPQGIGHSGHGHADALSIRLSINGQRFLTDPGTFCYMCEDRDKFRGTGAHNTLRVDEVDQAVPEGPFAWSSLPEVRAERWIAGSTFTLFAGSHTGYSRLVDPVIHRRVIFYLHGNFWLIRDIVDGQESHQLETSWHFASNIQLQKDGDVFIAESLQSVANYNSVRMKLVPVAGPQWEGTISSEFVSPAYGVRQPAPVIRMNLNIRLPAEHAVIIQPLLDGPTQSSKLANLGLEGAVHAYRYDESDIAHWMIFSDGEQPWTVGQWSSDAKFLYFQVRQRQLRHLIFSDGTFLKRNESFLIQSHQKLERLEWDKRAETAQIFASDHSVKQAFSTETMESCDSVF